MVEEKTVTDSGALLIDKPEGWTSHDVVNCVRRRFRIKKVGHCGTLDPLATGLLVIVFGRATKLSDRLSGQDKTYEGTIRFGVQTSTQDRDGEVVATAEVSGITEAGMRELFAAFEGEQLQIPPMVSAIKKDGKPLYKLARKGIEVEREPRPITVHRLELRRLALPEADFAVDCSKGTYVRTLCADIGARLGCGAHLQALRRTRSGNFDLSNAYSMDAIKTWENEDLLRNMIPLERLLACI
jgi:tRNA pseudouridine55 synthase